MISTDREKYPAGNFADFPPETFSCGKMPLICVIQEARRLGLLRATWGCVDEGFLAPDRSC